MRFISIHRLNKKFGSQLQEVYQVQNQSPEEGQIIKSPGKALLV